MYRKRRKNKVSRAEKERSLYDLDFIECLLDYYFKDDRDSILQYKIEENPVFYFYLENFFDEIR